MHVDRLEPRGATFAAVPMFEKEQREFLASRDDWFRPVFLASGPDGALYVCDMYRKIIEHPDYLPEEVRKRTDFESGKEMGRIWRVVKKNRADDEPQLALTDSTAANLVAALANGQAWKRDTAFRLIVERDRAEAVAALKSGLDRRKPTATILALRALHIHSALASSMIPEEVTGPEIELIKANEVVNDAVVQLLGIKEVRRRLDQLMLSEKMLVSRIRAENPNSSVSLAVHLMPTAIFRLPLALALGDEHDAEATAILAAIAVAGAEDRWFRAAVLSSSAGRERQLLDAIIARMPDNPAAPVELLNDLGSTIGASDCACGSVRNGIRSDHPFRVPLLLGDTAVTSGFCVTRAGRSPRPVVKRNRIRGATSASCARVLDRFHRAADLRSRAARSDVVRTSGRAALANRIERFTDRTSLRSDSRSDQI